jgi:hypothetical protein
LDNPQTLNLYAYVRNNPMVLVDEDGHDGCQMYEADNTTCAAPSAEQQANQMLDNTSNPEDMGSPHFGGCPNCDGFWGSIWKAFNLVGDYRDIESEFDHKKDINNWTTVLDAANHNLDVEGITSDRYGMDTALVKLSSNEIAYLMEQQAAPLIKKMNAFDFLMGAKYEAVLSATQKGLVDSAQQEYNLQRNAYQGRLLQQQAASDKAQKIWENGGPFPQDQ